VVERARAIHLEARRPEGIGDRHGGHRQRRKPIALRAQIAGAVCGWRLRPEQDREDEQPDARNEQWTCFGSLHGRHGIPRRE
jgi:hypothetical protein